jgi:thiol-disulfide isomerase/thioredoxin
MQRRVFLKGTALAAAAWVSSLALPRADVMAASAHPFYRTSYPGLNTDPAPISQYLGKPLVLNFWATWCAPCVKEMPDLDALQAAHPHVQIVGVAVDTAKNVDTFIKKVPVSYPLVIAGHGGIQQMRELGNTTGGLPYTVLFTSSGELSRQILGQINPEKLGPMLADLS